MTSSRPITAHHGVERDLLAVPEAVVLQPGRVPALAGVVVVADVGVGAGEHHLQRICAHAFYM